MDTDYSKISQTYDKYRLHSPRLVDYIRGFGVIVDNIKLLDLGCGTGDVACQLKNESKLDLIGLDRSLHMLEIARKKSLDVVRADVDNYGLPFRDCVFDRIISVYVIHHIKRLGSLFSECHRVMRSGYLLLLTSSHKQIESQHPVIKDFFPACVNIDLERFPNIPVIDRLLTGAGFHELQHEEILFDSIPIDHRYLEHVKNKFVSTYHLIDQREFEQGVKKLEDFINNLRKPEYREWRSTLIRGKKS